MVEKDPVVRAGLTEAAVEAIDALVTERAAMLRRDGARADALEEVRAGERLVQAVLRASTALTELTDEGGLAGGPLDGSASPRLDTVGTSASWVAVVRRLNSDTDPDWSPERNAGGDSDRNRRVWRETDQVRAVLVRCAPEPGHWWSALEAMPVSRSGITVQRDEEGRIAALTVAGSWESFVDLMTRGQVLEVDSFGSPTLFGAPRTQGWVWYHSDRPDISADWPFLRGIDLDAVLSPSTESQDIDSGMSN